MTTYANEELWRGDQDRARARLLAKEIVESMTVNDMRAELIDRFASELLHDDGLHDLKQNHQ